MLSCVARSGGWVAFGLAGLLLAGPAAGQEGQNGSGQVGPIGAVDEKIRTAQQLLVALERVDDRLETLQADIQYDRRFRLQGDQHVRRGKLYYFADREGESGEGKRVKPDRAFEIDFQTLWLVQAERKEQDRQTWVFDGRWLIEKRPDKKQFIAREIAAPGEEFDPLSIKEGIMPIPIGQRAADVLDRYGAQLVPHPDGLGEEPATLTAFVSDCHQLKLVPKPGHAEESKFEEIRLWYEKETLMPRMSRAVDRKGDVSFVQLLNVKRNERLPRGVMVIAPPPEDAGWDVQVERRGAAANAPAGEGSGE